MPDSVSLDDSPLFGTRGWIVSPATDPSGRGFPGIGASEEPDGDPGTWERTFVTNRWTVDGDIVEIVFAETTSTYWTVWLRLEERELRGTARRFRDTGPDPESWQATVQGEPIGCLPS